MKTINLHVQVVYIIPIYVLKGNKSILIQKYSYINLQTINVLVIFLSEFYVNSVKMF